MRTTTSRLHDQEKRRTRICAWAASPLARGPALSRRRLRARLVGNPITSVRFVEAAGFEPATDNRHPSVPAVSARDEAAVTTFALPGELRPRVNRWWRVRESNPLRAVCKTTLRSTASPEEPNTFGSRLSWAREESDLSSAAYHAAALPLCYAPGPGGRTRTVARLVQSQRVFAGEPPE